MAISSGVNSYKSLSDLSISLSRREVSAAGFCARTSKICSTGFSISAFFVSIMRVRWLVISRWAKVMRYFEKFRVQTSVCPTAALRWRLHAKAWTLNAKHNLSKLLLTCLVSDLPDTILFAHLTRKHVFRALPADVRKGKAFPHIWRHSRKTVQSA